MHQLYICSNSSCGNLSIEKKSITICKICKASVLTINVNNNLLTDNNRPNDLVSQELCLRSAKLIWHDGRIIDTWPGPIAYEYIRFKEMLCEGMVEASCWKLLNLIEVIIAFLFSAYLEISNELQILQDETNKRGFISTMEKLNMIKNHSFSWNMFNLFTSTAKSILLWRNKYGIGHGTLTRQKELLLKTIISYAEEINSSLYHFPQFLKDNKLCLTIQESSIKLNGSEYFENLNNFTIQITCTNSVHSYPVRVFGYNFDMPDIYFWDQLLNNGTVIQFRNFRNNRIKYINLQSENPNWGKAFNQVAWLEKKEREAWYNDWFLNNKQQIGSEHLSMFLEVANNFINYGMYDLARNTIIYYKQVSTNEDRNKENELFLAIIEYSLSTLLGRYDLAQSALHRVQNLLSNVSLDDQAFFETEIIRKRSWYDVVRKHKIDESIEMCKKHINKLDKLFYTHPYTTSLKIIELKRNILYFSRLLEEKDYANLREQCLDLIQEAYKLLAINFENYKIMDLIGITANLYTVFCIEDDKLNEIDKHNIWSVLYYGKKLRKRAYDLYSDDVWIRRGYAWSLHNEARLLYKLKKDPSGAEVLLNDALSVRTRGKEFYPMDLDLREDLLKNYEDLISLNTPGLNKRIVTDYYKQMNKILKDIKELGDLSERVTSWEEKMKNIKRLYLT